MATDRTAAQSNFVSVLRNATNQLLDARQQIKAQRELAATQAYPDSFTDQAFGEKGNDNFDLSRDDVTALFGAMDALEMLLTDFSKTPPEPTATLAAILKFRR